MTRRVYVGNLNWAMTSVELREVCSEYGVVVDACVIYGPDNRSRGFGFSEFYSDEGAERFRREAQGRIVMGRDLRIKDATSRLRDGGRGRGYPAERRCVVCKAYCAGPLCLTCEGSRRE